MSRTRRSAFLALFGYVAVVAAGCRRDPAPSNRPSAPDRDTIEAWVEHPPANVGDRKRLAWEQYLYCEDIVSQGAGHVSALANELSAPAWFFWWD